MAIPAKHIRFTTVIKYVSLVGFAGHFLYIFLLLWVGTTNLAIFNFFASFVYLAAYWINQKGRPHLAILLGAAEVVIHGFHASTDVGWTAGFHFYMLAFIPLIFYAPGWQLSLKVIFTSILCTLYVILGLYTQSVQPRNPITPQQTKILLTMNSITMFLVTSTMAFFYRMATLNAEKELQKTNKKLEDLATTDPLTGLFNRRTMMSMIETEASRISRNGTTFALILADIDNFKLVNDRYGHETGDKVLIEVSNLLKQSLRAHDQIARWGGEEFLILLPETDLVMAGQVAERLRSAIETTQTYLGDTAIPVTITFGVSGFTAEAEISVCINLADKALYEGKIRGKNCVVVNRKQKEKTHQLPAQAP
jgi:diguanylate cyclase (GGDEF)-like protein